MSAAKESTQVLRTRHRQGGHTPIYNQNQSYHAPGKATEHLNAKENACVKGFLCISEPLNALAAEVIRVQKTMQPKVDVVDTWVEACEKAF